MILDNTYNQINKTFEDSLTISNSLEKFYKQLQSGIQKLLLDNHQLSMSEVEVLKELLFTYGSEKTLSPTELYEKLDFSSGGMTKVLKKLENKKYITRIENPEDKRSKLVKLTILGEDTTKRVHFDILEYQEDFFSTFSSQEIQILKILLSKILDKDKNISF